ncbi:MAG: cytochrome c biogenesis protein CcsA [Phycisphaerae bacterium]
MEFRPTPVNWMVLGAMGAYVAAALALGAGALVGMGRAPGKVARALRVAGWAFFAAGFAVSLAAWLIRWHEVQHAPLQNLYEVCLTMGALMLPISLFCRLVLRVGAEWMDAVLAAVVLFPVAMVFNPEPQHLPAALQSPLFVPHVATYLAAYVVLGKAAVQAFGCLVRRPVATGDSTGRAELTGETLGGGLAAQERATYAMVCFGFPLLTLGLVLGAWWGKLAWGDYWNWDPKELWSFVSWLVFLGYLHFRAVRGPRSPVLGSVLVLAGTACILITLLWANLSRLFAGLHSYAT